LTSKNSCGFDGISTKLIKQSKHIFIRPLTIIINQMLNTGIFPDQLKLSKVVPIHKKDDENLFTNYRPISLLPSISKCFEKVIFNQLYQYFKINNLFYNAQYGFRDEHSTEYAAYELIDKLIQDLDKKETPVSIFLDLSKAFDTLDHSILLDKLQHYGVNGTALKLLTSYLENRKQYVDIDGTKSEIRSITTGVPQGSILGPLLFIIYINDIANASKLFNFIIYADDTTLRTTIEIVLRESNNTSVESHINKELELINEWLKLNKLSLNINKSKYIIFHTLRKTIKPIKLKIEQTQIEQVHEFNFLGLTINEHLNWKDHIDKISSKISKTMGILNKLKHFIPQKAKLHIYNSLILSHLNFGILAWGYQCDRIFKLQKKVVRIICVSKYNAHSDPLFKSLNLLKVSDILRLQLLKFYYKYKNGNLPYYLVHLPFPTQADIHDHLTRGQYQLRTVKPHHEYARYCIRYQIPIVINSTPNEILTKITTHSLEGFRKYIKHTMIQSYQEVCTIQNCYVCSRQ
jgi:hypothetical protein